MSLVPHWLCKNNDKHPSPIVTETSSNKSKKNINQSSLEIEPFLEKYATGPFENYDPIAEIHYYMEFLKSMPIPADYFSLDSIQVPEENRYGDPPEDFYNEDKYLNLNADIENFRFEEDYTSEIILSSDSERFAVRDCFAALAMTASPCSQ